MEGSIEFHGLVKLTESKITGVAAFPRLSRNGRFYPPSELAKLDGRTVPILWAHQGTPEQKTDPIPEDKIIGQATVHWDSDLQQLKYEGKIKEEYAGFVKKYADKLQVSLGAHYRPQRVCTGADCFEAATNLHFEEISLTPSAGMPETDVKVVESAVSPCEHCEHNKLLEEYKKATESKEEDPLAGLDPASRIKIQQAMKRS